MEKKNTILLTVIAIATLLVAVIGATFAYFTATVNSTGSNSTSATAANLSGLNVQVSELRQIDKGIYPGWVGYQKITITAPEGTVDGAQVRYDLNMKSTNGFDADTTTNNLTYEIYRCTKDKVCAVLDEDDIYDQGDLKVEDILDNDSKPTGVKKYYFDGAEFTIDDSAPDYDSTTAATLPTHTGDSSKNISGSSPVLFKKGNTHVYYVVYRFKNVDSEQNALQGKVFTTSFNATVENLNELGEQQD